MNRSTISKDTKVERAEQRLGEALDNLEGVLEARVKLISHVSSMEQELTKLKTRTKVLSDENEALQEQNKSLQEKNQKLYDVNEEVSVRLDTTINRLETVIEHSASIENSLSA